MDMLNQIDRNLYLEVARKQAELWTEVFQALSGGWKRSVSSEWSVDPQISEEDVLADLSYGRD